VVHQLRICFLKRFFITSENLIFIPIGTACLMKSSLKLYEAINSLLTSN